MFTSLLLTTAVAAGQPPAGYYPPGVLPARPAPAAPPGYYPVAQQTARPGTLPQYSPTGAQPTPMPMTDPVPMTKGGNGKADFPGNENPTESKGDKEADEDNGPTKYLLEKTLAGTRLGEVLNNRGITIYGWTEFSYNASTASGSNAPVFMIDRANEFMLNQNYVVVEKTLDTKKDEIQWGWRTDWILPGADARTTVVRGLWDVQLRNNNGGPQLYPIDLFQAYGQVYLPGLGQGTTVKLGRFATHVGYELVQAVDTPFISRSYMFQYNPFTHTGVWATTQLTDDWSVGYGLSTGTDTFLDAPTNRPTFLGQVKWAPKDGDTTAAFNVVITNPNFIPQENFQLYNFYNLVVTQKLSEKLSYVLDTGYTHMGNFPGFGLVNWYGAANYLTYAHSDTVSSTLRAEVFDDPQGARTGFRGLYSEVTYGVAWKPCPGVIVRPSVRYDNNSISQAFEGSQNLFTAAMDVILRW